MVGKVVAAHGIRGNLKVSSYAESLSVYETEGGIQIALPDGSVRPMTVRWVQPHGRHLLLNLDRVTDRNQAADRPKLPKPGSPSGKKVAIVGAGPAGLTAAFYLRQRGHACTLFDAHPKPGGMLRSGIPPYRLPREIIDCEADFVRFLDPRQAAGHLDLVREHTGLVLDPYFDLECDGAPDHGCTSRTYDDWGEVSDEHFDDDCDGTVDEPLASSATSCCANVILGAL